MYDTAIENYKNTIKSRKDRKNISIKITLLDYKNTDGPANANRPTRK